MLKKIVSGGQTGVDRAALDAAEKHGIPTGGWCPKGRRAEDGSIPKRYPLKETPEKTYEQRTAWNVRDSDGTLIVTDGEMKGGTALTAKEARERQKPLLHVKTSDPVPVEMIRAWREDNNVRILNVAGPRESESSGIYVDALDILDRFLEAELATV